MQSPSTIDQLFQSQLQKPEVSRIIELKSDQSSIAREMPKKRRAGIYILRYSTGEYYVG